MASGAEELRAALLAAARDNEAQRGFPNVFGDRYVIDFELVRSLG